MATSEDADIGRSTMRFDVDAAIAVSVASIARNTDMIGDPELKTAVTVGLNDRAMATTAAFVVVCPRAVATKNVVSASCDAVAVAPEADAVADMNIALDKAGLDVAPFAETVEVKLIEPLGALRATATTDQSPAAPRSPVPPIVLEPEVVSVFVHADTLVASPPAPVELLIDVLDWPPGTVNVRWRCVPKATRVVDAVVVVNVHNISTSSVVGGPAFVPLASIAPLPFVPLVSTPVAFKMISQAGFKLPVIVAVTVPEDGSDVLRPRHTHMRICVWAFVKPLEVISVHERPVPLSDGVIDVVRITRQTKNNSLAAGSTLAIEMESPVVMLAGDPTSDTEIAMKPPKSFE